jgi:primary-amine oxidase
VDFEFFTKVGDAGLALYDIRYKGERIIYELAMQEALAHYAGVQQDAASTAYLDVSIDFSPETLVPGYDCPAYATYASEGRYCIFEYPMDFPIQRHEGENMHVTGNIAFVLRAVSTIGSKSIQIQREARS